MQKQPFVRTLVILNLVSVLLAAIGNLLGNVTASGLPAEWGNYAEWAKYAGLAFVIAVILYVIVSVVLTRLQEGTTVDSPQALRSWLRRLVIVALITCDEVLASIAGFLSNFAVSSLPASIKPFVPLVYVGVAITAIVISVGMFSLQSTPRTESTNRKKLLKRLQGMYSRRFEEALDGISAIELGLKQVAPEAVIRPTLALGTFERHSALEQATMLPAGTTIAGAFDLSGGRMLILGDPGAGKTTLLLELALDLLEHAREREREHERKRGRRERGRERKRAQERTRNDRSDPLPIIFNLSTWTTNRFGLDSWLVEDLVHTYHVPLRTARGWITSRKVLPLLDGLDEMNIKDIEACISALNQFIETNRDMPVVVCSRIDEYSTQTVALKLRTAVVVQRLSDEQVASTLARGGEGLAALREAVLHNRLLRDLLRTPLFLSLGILTYRDVPPDEIPPVTDRQGWLRQLFSEYVTRMLERKRKSERAPAYQAEDVERYLAWLAHGMATHYLVQFSVKDLQFDWLLNAKSRFSYVASIGLVYGLIGCLIGGLSVRLPAALALGGIFGCVGLLRASTGNTEYAAYEPPTWKRRLAFSLAFGLVCGLVFGWGEAYLGGLGGLVGASIGMLVGLLAGIIIGGGHGARTAAIAGITAPIGLAFGFITGADRYLLLALGISFAITRIFYVFTAGLPTRAPHFIYVILEFIPGWGFSLFAACLAGALTGPVFGHTISPASGLVVGPILLLVNDPVVVLMAALVGGLLDGLVFGGDLPLRRAMLRLALQLGGVTPHRFIHFLDYAADHVLLQKVGKAYRFVHMLLRDYFEHLK